MARVQLELPEQFLYTHTINVRMTDLNTGKHVGNDQMISLLSEARYRFFCDVGFDQFERQGQSIVVTDLVATYKAAKVIGYRNDSMPGMIKKNEALFCQNHHLARWSPS